MGAVLGESRRYKDVIFIPQERLENRTTKHSVVRPLGRFDASMRRHTTLAAILASAILAAAQGEPNSVWDDEGSPSDTSSPWYPPLPKACDGVKRTQPDCTLHVESPAATLWAWKTYEATTTFTAATVVTVINTVRNFTTRSTVFNTVPAGFQPPKTNEAGTRVDTVTYNIYSLGKPPATATTVV